MTLSDKRFRSFDGVDENGDDEYIKNDFIKDLKNKIKELRGEE